MGALLERHPELMGLGEDEATVYAFLDKKNESTAREISDCTEIPYSRVHDVLNSLQKKELIVSRGESPKTYALRFKDPALNKESGYVYYI